jgi:hypothetical protein
LPQPHGSLPFTTGLQSIQDTTIAAAIINFNANTDLVGDTFDDSVKFVAVAFRGYGFDTARPGD